MPDPKIGDALQRALNGRYRVERELGRGGTAVVFLAQDARHGRRVAVKVLLPELAHAIGPERFLREIAIVARLRHPHILPLHDSGEGEGLLYYVMPYVEGESLRDRIRRERRLPVVDAVRITCEVASALDRAHREGIVHRDIKPENILLDGDFAFVADFGIARVLGGESDGTPITQAGLVVGTPQYMSPEQIGGSGDLDPRSDAYSLGCVLYEMLCGVPPFRGQLRELLAQHSLAPVPDPRTHRSGIPPNVASALLRVLQKEPAQRFASVQAFAQALVLAPEMAATAATPGSLWDRVRSLLGRQPGSVRTEGGALATPSQPTITPYATGSAPGQATTPHAMPSGAGIPTPLVTTPSGRAAIDSLAVLPFVAQGGDEETGYLCEGVTEAIMHKLAGIAGLRIVPRSVVFRYRESDRDPIEIARTLGARAVVTGRVRQRGEQLVVTAELVDTASESQLWGERYNRTISDIFAVQEEMATEITRSLRLRLSGTEVARLAQRYTEDAAAYRAYLRGRHHWGKRTVEGLRQAIQHFQQAIDQDPAFALAYTGLADTFNILGYYNNERPTDAYTRGKAAILKALSLDEALAPAHASLGYLRLFFDRDWAGAEASFLRALELDPAYATAHQWRAWYLFTAERFDEALQELQRALELEPLSLIINDHLGYALLLAGRPQEALDQLTRTRELDPSFPWTYWRLGSVYTAMGRHEEAVAAFARVVEMTAGGVGLGYLGQAEAAAGRRANAEAVLQRLEARAAERYVSPLEFALTYAGLGRHDEALAAFERAATERVSDIVRLRLFPLPAELTGDPRFSALVRRLSLPA